MAGPPPVEVTAIWDGTRLKTGSEEAERSIESLADSIDIASRDIQDSLQAMDDGVSTTLGTGGTFSRSVDDVEAEGSRLKDAGAEIGAEFSENIGEGFRNGDYVGVLTETLTSLGPALGVAGIGVGVGAALVKGMIDGAEKRRQEFAAAVNGIFDQIELKAGQSMRQIRRQILGTFDFTSVVEQLGGEGGFEGGMRKINLLMDTTGAKFDDIVSILQGRMNPRLKGVVDLMAEAVGENDKFLGVTSDVVGRLQDENKAFGEVVKQGQANAAHLEEAEKFAGQTVDHFERMKGDAESFADSNERAAAAMERAEAAGARIAGNLGNAVRQARLLDLALGG